MRKLQVLAFHRVPEAQLVLVLLYSLAIFGTGSHSCPPGHVHPGFFLQPGRAGKAVPKCLEALPPFSVPALDGEQLSCCLAVSTQAGPPPSTLAPPWLASVHNIGEMSRLHWVHLEAFSVNHPPLAVTMTPPPTGSPSSCTSPHTPPSLQLGPSREVPPGVTGMTKSLSPGTVFKRDISGGRVVAGQNDGAMPEPEFGSRLHL